MFDRSKYLVRLESCIPKEPELVLSESEKQFLIDKIKKLLKQKNAVLVTHYYTNPDLQKLADETSGIVADSLEMARFGANSKAEMLVVVGVRFMGETAKILSPNKKVLVPDLRATCSLDEGCDPMELKSFCDEYPDRTVVVYVNTSAAVKALADWTVTSSCAVDIVNYLTKQGQKVIFAPDRFLGNYIKEQTNADMLIWPASCVVHEEFIAKALAELKTKHPEAAVLVHPESSPDVIALADVVGSTSKLLKATIDMPNTEFIVATEKGILYKMREASPNKKFIIAPTAKTDFVCDLCASCPWMKMNNLRNVAEVLENETNEIILPADIIEKAMIPLKRMLDFKMLK